MFATVVTLRVESTSLYLSDFSCWVDEVRGVYDDKIFIGFVWFKGWHFGISYVKNNKQVNRWKFNTLKDALMALREETSCGHSVGGKTQASAR